MQDVRMCSIVFCLHYSSNHNEHNRVSLSNTRFSEKPWVVKMRSRASILGAVFGYSIDITLSVSQ